MNTNPPENPLEIPFLQNIALVLTYKCQVGCPHCIVEAGPHRTEEMACDDVFNLIGEIAAYRNGHIRTISLTGGEPFCDVAKLSRIVDCATRAGLLVSMVTNGYWATSPEEAMDVLSRVSEVRLLAVSTDVYHLKSIPFDRVRNAIVAAKNLDMSVNIHVCTDNREDPEYMSLMDQLSQFVEPEAIITVETFPLGNASGMGAAREQTPLVPQAACCSGNSPTILPTGEVLACVGPIIALKSRHPLVLGHLRKNSLAEILDRAETNSVLHAIRVWGPRKLISILEEAGLGEHLPKAYIKDNICWACFRLMSCPEIVEHLEGLLRDMPFTETVAYARIYYMRETRMAQALGM